jgi:hypothetical protein
MCNSRTREAQAAARGVKEIRGQSACTPGIRRSARHPTTRNHITPIYLARPARVVALDTPHHITQRGNARRTIFFSDDNRRVYLDLLREEARHADLTILGYCLMSNHVHIIAIPHRLDSMATDFRHSHGR